MKQGPVIDFVVPWVDGGDPVWQKEKARYLGQSDTDAMIDAGEARFRDLENLRYWFRAVETYAPWVNKVHFITCGQKPEWLNLDAPKLNFVKHEDYIPAEFLPTFSSHVIELNLHRIEGLSEHFVYFNDDIFLTAPVRPEDFFVDGLPCDYLEESPLTFWEGRTGNGVKMNDILFLDKHFDRKKMRKTMKRKLYAPCDPKGMLRNLALNVVNDSAFFGIKIHHLTQTYRKSTFEQVWQVEEERLRKVCSHKFRDERDVNQYIFRFWQLLTGEFHPCNMRKLGRNYKMKWKLDEICDQIVTQNCKELVLHDEPEPLDFEAATKRINQAFETVLPNKSSFEL